MSNLNQSNSEDLPESIGYGFKTWRVYDYLWAALDNHAREKLDHLDSSQKRIIEDQVEWIFTKLYDFHIHPNDRDIVELVRKSTINDEDLNFALSFEVAARFLGHLDSAGERLLEVLPIISEVTPSIIVQPYLVEGIRCYMFQFDLACILTCRSAMEIGLKECLRLIEHPAYQENDIKRELCRVIEDATYERLITRNIDLAHRLRMLANDFIHKESRSNREDLEVLAFLSIRGLALVLTEAFQSIQAREQ
jgi:hypothetical protein